jgi:hypothetical protein
MTIEIKPATGKLVQEEIQSGHVGSVDELIVKGIEALREKSIARPEVARQKQRKHLVDVLSEAPFAGSDLNLERQRITPGTSICDRLPDRQPTSFRSSRGRQGQIGR